MKYIAILHKEKDSSYGITLPDFEGCFSAADSWEDIPANIQEAIELYAEDEEDFEPPVASSFEAVSNMEEAQGGTLMIVDIDFDFLDAKAVPVNITMPVYIRNRIDRAAKKAGMNRSAYLVKAALEYHPSDNP